MFELKGFDDFERKLKELQANAAVIDGENRIPIDELLGDDFLLKNSVFTSFQQMIDNSGFEVNNSDDFAAIPDKSWNEYIIANSNFESWQAMLEAAAAEWVQKKLGL